MTFIDDLIDGILLAAQHPAAVGKVYLIAGEKAVTLNELVARIAEALNVARPKLRFPLWPFELAAPVCQKLCRAIGVEPPLYPRRLEFFSDDRSFTIEKARREIGYKPKVSLQEGIRRTGEWYRKEGWL
jgi:nucleoside-diphosphate-sugar epimerase